MSGLSSDDDAASSSDSFSEFDWEFDEAAKRETGSRAQPWSVDSDSSSSASDDREPPEPLAPSQAQADVILPRIVLPPHPCLQLVDSPDLDAFAADTESEERKADLLRFDGTVVAIFRKLVLDFNSPQIALTIGEVYSMCIGAKYLSVDGTVKTIRERPAHYQRVAAAVERNCVCTSRSGTRWALRPFLTAESELA
jgi:hypothetical protein